MGVYKSIETQKTCATTEPLICPNMQTSPQTQPIEIPQNQSQSEQLSKVFMSKQQMKLIQK